MNVALGDFIGLEKVPLLLHHYNYYYYFYFFPIPFQVLTIISVLSSESIFVNPTGRKEAAANARRKFISVEGDHITLLKVFRAFKAAKRNKVDG